MAMDLECGTPTQLCSFHSSADMVLTDVQAGILPISGGVDEAAGWQHGVPSMARLAGLVRVYGQDVRDLVEDTLGDGRFGVEISTVAREGGASRFRAASAAMLEDDLVRHGGDGVYPALLTESAPRRSTSTKTPLTHPARQPNVIEPDTAQTSSGRPEVAEVAEVAEH